MTKQPSKFAAPVFIASTVAFFLGSAFKFIFGKEQQEQSAAKAAETHLDYKKNDVVAEEDETPHEPEEDPVSSL